MRSLKHRPGTAPFEGIADAVQRRWRIARLARRAAPVESAMTRRATVAASVYRVDMTNDSASPGLQKRPQASVWRLAARQVWRDFSAGELKLLLWAVVLAVGALSAV